MHYQKTNTYIAFKDSEKLWRNVDTFIDNMNMMKASTNEKKVRSLNNQNDQIPLLVDIMHDFLDEAIDVFFLKACEAVNLAPFTFRIVNATVSTIKSTCHMLARNVLRKMKNHEVQELSHYMDLLRVVLVDDGGNKAAFTAIPITDNVRDELMSIIEALNTDLPSKHKEELIHILVQLMDVAVEYLYSNPLSTLKLGPIASKLIQVSYKTIHKASHLAIIKVVPSLSDDQLRDAAHYFQSLVVPVPPNEQVQNTQATFS